MSITAVKRTELCDEVIELARLVKGVPQKTWAGYPEREREQAEQNLAYARNFLKAIFEDER